MTDFDAHARYYQWFMTENAHERIVGYEFWPEGETVSSPMAHGKLVFFKRENPGDVWEPPHTVTDSIAWSTANALAEMQGFTVAVPVK